MVGNTWAGMAISGGAKLIGSLCSASKPLSVVYSEDGRPNISPQIAFMGDLSALLGTFWWQEERDAFLSTSITQHLASKAAGRASSESTVLLCQELDDPVIATSLTH